MRRKLPRLIATGCLRAGGLLLVLTALGSIAQAIPTGQPAVPEIDPGSMASALALLTGGMLMIRGWRRKS